LCFCEQRELSKFQKLIDNVQTDEVALDEKIAKRVEEKDRHQRRHDMLKSVRYRKIFLCILINQFACCLDHHL
jgi:hypothetical protein